MELQTQPSWSVSLNGKQSADEVDLERLILRVKELKSMIEKWGKSPIVWSLIFLHSLYLFLVDSAQLYPALYHTLQFFF